MKINIKEQKAKVLSALASENLSYRQPRSFPFAITHYSRSKSKFLSS